MKVVADVDVIQGVDNRSKSIVFGVVEVDATVAATNTVMESLF